MSDELREEVAALREQLGAFVANAQALLENGEKKEAALQGVVSKLGASIERMRGDLASFREDVAARLAEYGARLRAMEGAAPGFARSADLSRVEGRVARLEETEDTRTQRILAAASERRKREHDALWAWLAGWRGWWKYAAAGLAVVAAYFELKRWGLVP